MTDYETQSENINWEGIAADVSTALQHIRLAWECSEAGDADLHAKLVHDLYAPALYVLSEFVACVKVEELDG